MRENCSAMKDQNKTVAIRTLIMAAILVVGVVAALVAKGLIATTGLTS